MSTNHTTTDSGTTVGGRFLEALASRDFDGLAACLRPDARMRAVLPLGHVDRDGADAIAEELRGWFGAAEDFELVTSCNETVGPRLKLRWHLRMRPAPIGPGWHVVEQSAFADAEDRITALDVVCSGFNPEEPS